MNTLECRLVDYVLSTPECRLGPEYSVLCSVGYVLSTLTDAMCLMEHSGIRENQTSLLVFRPQKRVFFR